MLLVCTKRILERIQRLPPRLITTTKMSDTSKYSSASSSSNSSGSSMDMDTHSSFGRSGFQDGAARSSQTMVRTNSFSHRNLTDSTEPREEEERIKRLASLPGPYIWLLSDEDREQGNEKKIQFLENLLSSILTETDTADTATFRFKIRRLAHHLQSTRIINTKIERSAQEIEHYRQKKPKNVAQAKRFFKYWQTEYQEVVNEFFALLDVLNGDFNNSYMDSAKKAIGLKEEVSQLEEQLVMLRVELSKSLEQARNSAPTALSRRPEAAAEANDVRSRLFTFLETFKITFIIENWQNELQIACHDLRQECDNMDLMLAKKRQVLRTMALVYEDWAF